MSRQRSLASPLRRCRLLLTLFAASLLGSAASAQSLSNLTQLSFDLDGVVTPFTEWSTVDLSYTGMSSVQYFNLNYNGSWVIQNMPVLSREGLISQTQQFAFHNGVFSRGVDLTGLSPSFLSATLTPTLQGVPANTPATLAFAPDFEVFDTGTQPETTGLLFAPLVVVGATLPVTMSAAHKGFPNQEAGTLECAPTAISNSLMFLKDKNPSPQWTGKALDIGTMKTATSWDATRGCWIFHNDARVGSSKNAFWEDKDAYMKANGYPVMTKTTTSFADILAAMKAMKDVELELKGHTVALVGMTDLGGGKYSLDIAHDADQSTNPGGTKVETITWDGTSFTGAKW
ncbi:MAG: hypothetical protein H0T51_11800, partial [Pirellulales bacterium]|nr:hypothetical protein [Pirellulales bacterium]